MPRVNFDQADSIGGAVPKGKYLCQVKAIEEKASKESGRPYWVMKMEILEGDEKGNTIEDRLFFTKKSLGRLKFVVKRLTGMELTGEVDLEPDTLVGAKAYVEVEEEENEWEGETYKRNNVLFRGYEEYKGSPETGSKSDDTIPF